MTVPDWKTISAGGRVRVALWLYTEIGDGGSFRKAQLRDAFPSVEQIDRRMRELRREGWVIATYREDRSLAPDELQLVRTGGRVWEQGYRSTQAQALTDKERRAVLAADEYMCTCCGVCAGEVYPDNPLRQAKLLTARTQTSSDGNEGFSTVCDRCHVGDADAMSAGELMEEIERIDASQRKQLRRWIASGERTFAVADKLWATYRRLPQPDKVAVAEALALPGLAK